ncbi:uncharacterized protein LOC135080707 [Ostrinia nubilalis]|uniref:uncharacterized protein LOC135080707 n=1 Tax=Ostrinia nubilalis TaxID=29057 RepID=UPI0030824127
MPPKTRARTTKSSKENIGVVEKSKTKTSNKSAKPRKALADKTNSASDDNDDVPKKTTKKAVTKAIEIADENTQRPRRERRLPNRFVENQVLISLSNSKESEEPKSVVNKSKTPNKNDTSIVSPFKTPQKDADNSLLAPRPKRICRLPSKFDDHSVSPNKFIPVGCHASTPILPNKGKPDSKVTQKPTSQNLTSKSYLKSTSQNIAKQPRIPLKKNPEKTSDTNNNAKQRLLKSKAPVNKSQSPEKWPVKTAGQKLLEKSFSFRVLDDKKKKSSLKRDSGHLDVYEFTFDPNEEPPPQKKKRKRTVKKKPAKPKTVVFKNNYDQNVNKALAALKNIVASNTKQFPTKSATAVQNQAKNAPKPQITVTDTVKQSEPKKVTEEIQNVTDINHVSVGIEDIAADIEPLPDHFEVNYSPVTSPNRPKSPIQSTTQDHSINRTDNDPLKLQEDFSFFDEPPVASSSMNMSVRRPHASPWRVQFEQLPIRWQANTYVKPNMTPAVECSFINIEDNKKKHVYTNMVPEDDEVLPEIVDNNQPNLKQTSIISFIKEMAEKSASKRKRARSVTPTKANSLFEDVSHLGHGNKDTAYQTPRKTPRKEAPEISPAQESAEKNESNSSKSSNNEDKENSSEGKSSKKNTPGKSKKDKSKDGTFFGFDDSEDQENMSPVKIDNPRVRALRPRARVVLQEINAQTGPCRANIPLAAKTKVATSSEAVNQVYDEMKSASDAPVFPEKNTENVGATDLAENSNAQELDDDDNYSVHLFEDIEVVHHLKPTRKSYGKAKKVTFRQGSTSGSDTRANDIVYEQESGEEDDLADLTFTMPNMEKTKAKKKAKPKKRDLSKKEKAELEAWAAGFNSMCEDIEEFPLMVE